MDTMDINVHNVRKDEEPVTAEVRQFTGKGGEQDFVTLRFYVPSGNQITFFLPDVLAVLHLGVSMINQANSPLISKF